MVRAIEAASKTIGKNSITSKMTNRILDYTIRIKGHLSQGETYCVCKEECLYVKIRH